jgi:hypothetical protein
MPHNPELKNAVQVLCKALKNDPDMYYAYQSNIAMQFYDEMLRHGIEPADLHTIANNSAKNFLNLLIRGE